MRHQIIHRYILENENSIAKYYTFYKRDSLWLDLDQLIDGDVYDSVFIDKKEKYIHLSYKNCDGCEVDAVIDINGNIIHKDLESIDYVINDLENGSVKFNSCQSNFVKDFQSSDYGLIHRIVVENEFSKPEPYFFLKRGYKWLNLNQLVDGDICEANFIGNTERFIRLSYKYWNGHLLESIIDIKGNIVYRDIACIIEVVDKHDLFIVRFDAAYMHKDFRSYYELYKYHYYYAVVDGDGALKIAPTFDVISYDEESECFIYREFSSGEQLEEHVDFVLNNEHFIFEPRPYIETDL
ncbi:hypothetical protein K3G39_06935 [Pontibacter sp. HSC-14F20]|uniref:hypothetical protein n=1 Tax=Pontibacter sp. HSC-14F20 TaxID=2864136 RepID=UPI001C733120|nr:hypothetical protein [Pontibacter sp. HSC-14F20]MBX0332968.1 hypothetical protein [Pontibacter sp. HSC-14F20]